jgi:hypothetical protein
MDRNDFGNISHVQHIKSQPLELVLREAGCSEDTLTVENRWLISVRNIPDEFFRHEPE